MHLKKKAFSSKVLLLPILLIMILSACSDRSEADQSSESDENFPEKPIEIIIPYGAGGATDQIGRILQDKLPDYLPNNAEVQIVNTPGGGGTIGLTNLLNSNPDGYTIGFTASGAITNQPNYGETAYDHDSFQAISRVATSPILLAVNEDEPYDSLDEFTKFLEENSGEFVYSSSGTGNPAHIAMEKLSEELGVETVNVPADGSSEAFVAMLGGNVNGTTGSSQQFAGKDESEGFKIIGNLGNVKGEGYQDVPTLGEVGIETSTDIFYGFLGPDGMPEEHVKILSDAFSQVLEEEEVQEQFKAAGIVADYAGPEEYQELITESYESEGEVLRNMELIE